MNKHQEVERPVLAELMAFCHEHPQVIQVLIGPRQVGKTTLARPLIARLPCPAVKEDAQVPLSLP